MTKIVRIIARLNVGGPARHVVWLTSALQDEEFESVLLAGTVPAGEEDMSYFAIQNSVEPVYIKQMSRELSLKDAVSLWKVYRFIRRTRPDIIHTHTAKAGTIGRAAGFLYRWMTPGTLIGRPRPVRLVHTYHGHVFHSYYGNLKTRIFLFIEKTLSRLATDKIVVISRQQFDEIHGDFKVGRSEEQFAVVPLGIDLDVYSGAEGRREVLRREIGAEKDEILIGLVGRLTAIKNIGLFLEAAKQLQQTADSPQFRFLIIGDGEMRENLKQTAAELKVNVEFLGNRNDPEVFYAGLDIVALTSLNEGTPLSLIEAMANGLPVIATRVGGVVDLLGAETDRTDEDGFTVWARGLAVPSEDAGGFARGLLCLAKDAALRRDLGESGRQYVYENYSKRRLVSDIKRIYRELRGNR